MKWLEVSIYTSDFGTEIVSDALSEIGFSSVLIENKKDLKKYLEENKNSWDLLDEDLLDEKDDRINVKVYVSEDDMEKTEEIKDMVSLLKAGDINNELGSLDISYSRLENEDWANNWKKYFKPFEVGKNIVVKPTWEKYENKESKLLLEIDPGASFGTGSHETTKLCMLALEKYVKKNDVVVDVGCGSGILSVLAAKLNSKKVVAVDIDEMAVEVCKKSLNINGVLDKVEVFKGDLAEKIDLKADVIVANIFAHIIKRLIPDTKRLLNKDGIFISSGIIDDTIDIVRSAYDENGFEILEENKMGDWWSVVGKIK